MFMDCCREGGEGSARSLGESCQIKRKIGASTSFLAEVAERRPHLVSGKAGQARQGGDQRANNALYVNFTHACGVNLCGLAKNGHR